MWENEPTWSVTEISQAIDAALRRAFPKEVWLRGEIRNLKRGDRMVWFDLVEPAPNDDPGRPPVATLPVVLFDMARRQVNTRLRQSGGAVRMEDGTEVRVRGQLGWWGMGGRLQLHMTDIDPDFTLGRLAANRTRLLRRLDAEGLLRRQAALSLPLVPLRLGLVTSAASAAEHDVLDELARARIGFRVVRADVRVQGRSAPRSVAWGLRAVASRGVDVVLLVRGGGASTELATFDNEVIARTIASLDVPVATGIGHDIDRTVADEVAHVAYKTPTACAQAMVSIVRAFEAALVTAWTAVARAARDAVGSQLAQLQSRAHHVAVGSRHGLVAADRTLSTGAQRLGRSADAALVRSGQYTERTSRRIETGVRVQCASHVRRLDALQDRLTQRAPRSVDAHERRLASAQAQLRALDPARVLARGWSITRSADGAVVRSPDQVASGDTLETTVAGGKLRSVVQDRSTERDR